MPQEEIGETRLVSAGPIVGLHTNRRVGVAWYGRTARQRKAATADPLRSGMAVRRDWPQTGHDFVAFGVAADAAARWVVRDAAFWRPGPVRPSYSLVQISARDFYLHARHRLGCRAPDCPAGATPAELASGVGR